jgi:alcohol dehydrogenase
VIAVDINEESLQRARTLGAVYTVNASETNVVDRVLEICQGGVNVSMDALGSHETSVNSINSLAKKGKHIQVGILGDQNTIPVSTSDLIAKEIEIIGSHGMPIADYETIFSMAASKKIDLSLLIDRTITLEQVHQELARMDTYTNAGMVVIDQF